MTHDYCTCGADRGSCIDCTEAEIDRLTAKLAECEKEVERLNQILHQASQGNAELIGKVIQEARKQAARECVNILQNKCNQWLEKHRLDSSWQSLAANEIRHKFGLEG